MGRSTYGHSLIISPWGEILSEAGVDEQVIFADIEPARVAEARSRIPSLSHDRDIETPSSGGVSRIREAS